MNDHTSTSTSTSTRRTNTLIIGGGQAGLAMSRCLTERDIDHVVLERGKVGDRWRTRWDSLRLLTPNWQSRLPGFRYEGPEPDSFMTSAEVVTFLESYARSFGSPVEEDTSVLGVRRASEDVGFEIETSRGRWHAANVVIATGYCDVPFVPAFGAALEGEVLQLTPSDYRNPESLPQGGVLVVGASATGIQLADEIHRSGRPVTLSVGRHTRMRRTYRGKDILWWLDEMGVLNESIDAVYDPEISRRQPSLQLVGRPDHTTLDLPALQASGVRLVGRTVGASGTQVRFDSDLVAHTASADIKLASLLARIDAFAGGAPDEAEAFIPFWPPPDSGPSEIDLEAEGIRTVLWATGFRRRYPWLHIPVLDDKGELRHEHGVTPAEGLYVLGLQFQSRRKSAFIDGVGADAHDLAEHIHARSLRNEGVRQ